MASLVESFIVAFANACREQVGPSELPLFLGRMVAWRLLEMRLPENLRGPSEAEEFNAQDLRDRWERLTAMEALGAFR